MAKLYIVTGSEPPFRREPNRGRYFTPTQKTNVYDAVEAASPDGISRKDIAQRVSLAPDRISFYLSELSRGGYITSKGEAVDPTAVLPTMSAQDAKFALLLGLENLLVCVVNELPRVGGKVVTPPELERSYVRYSKIKELALRPGTGPEGAVALRMAVLELVKMVF